MRRNIYFSLVAQWSSAAVSVVSSVLVARMMLPAELGVFTVTMALVGVLLTVQSVGAQEYLLYTAEIGIAERRAALGLNLASALAVAIILVLISPLAVHFYHNEGIRPVLFIVALNILISVGSAPIASMLGREQRFDLIALFAVISNIALSGMQIVSTWLGFSYIGLAWCMVFSTVLSVSLHWIFVRRHVLIRPSFRNMGPLLKFGGKLFGVNLMSQINNNSPQIIIGALTGLGDAALYGRSNTITQIYAQTVSRAVDPVINARLAAEGRSGQSTAKSLQKSSEAMLAISMPFFGFMGLYAHLIIPMMFGAQWAAAIPATQALCCGFLVWPLTSPTAAALLAAGRPGMLLRIRTVNTIARIALIVLLSPFGLGWIAVGVTLSIYLNLTQSLIALRSAAGISIRDYARGIASSGAASFAVLGVSALALWVLSANFASPWLILIGGAFATGIAWLAVIAASRHMLWQEIMLGRDKLVTTVRAYRAGKEFDL